MRETDPRKTRMTDDSLFVRTEQRADVLWITLRRDAQQNAINPLTVHLLSKAVDDALQSPTVRGIVIAGHGPNFCVGADLSFFQRHVEQDSLDAIERFSSALHGLCERIAAAQKPVIAAIQGAALGAGLELALACHCIVATRNATLALPETGLGICPGAGGTQRLPRRIGVGLAKWLIYTGQLLSANKALALGLIEHCVSDAELHDTAQSCALQTIHAPTQPLERTALPAEQRAIAEWLERYSLAELLSLTTLDPQLVRLQKKLAGRPRGALLLAEQLIDAGQRLPLTEALRLEIAAQRAMFSTLEARAGLAKAKGGLA